MNTACPSLPSRRASWPGSSTRRPAVVRTLVAVLQPYHGRVYDPRWQYGTPSAGNANFARQDYILTPGRYGV